MKNQNELFIVEREETGEWIGNTGDGGWSCWTTRAEAQDALDSESDNCEDQRAAYKIVPFVREPKPFNYVIVAEGEGAGVTVVSGALEQPLHDFMCSCGQFWRQCPSEGIHEDLDRTQDNEEWSTDEDGRPFSISWKFEIGRLAVYRHY